MTSFPEGTHVRVHPLLHWTEVDIWKYTKRENIPVIDLYFAKNGKRYRSLGDHDITSPIQSEAATLDEIIARAGDDPGARARGPGHGPRVRGCVRAAARRRLHVRRARTMPQTKNENRQLRIVIVGHVDHGKSTLVGRLIHETGSLPDGKLDAIKAMSERRGMPFEWAFLMDAIQAERDQGITIDTTQIWFHTPKRPYVIIDAPGHKEFLKNMVTGAASSEAALLLIDAHEGVQEQSRRHGYLLHLLGVKQVAVLVNKMDLVGYSADRFGQVAEDYRAYLRGLGVTPACIVPISAREGDNMVEHSSADALVPGPDRAAGAGRASSTRSCRPSGRCACRCRTSTSSTSGGSSSAGSRAARVRVGDEVVFSPSNKTAKIKTIEAWHVPEAPELAAGRAEHRRHARPSRSSSSAAR